MLRVRVPDLVRVPLNQAARVRRPADRAGRSPAAIARVRGGGTIICKYGSSYSRAGPAIQATHAQAARAIRHHTREQGVRQQRSRAMRCEWIIVKDRVYQCRRCGKTIGAAPGVAPRWDAMPDCKGPTVAAKVVNYAAAFMHWIEAGRPVRGERDIERIANICTSCNHYADNHCRLCGCRLRGSSALFSKIRMATEHCPIGKW